MIPATRTCAGGPKSGTATGPSASMTLNANGGDITDTFQGSHTGRILATSLFAHALGNIIIDNTAGAGNQIGPIVNVSATNGGVILTNGQNLFFIGPVSAGLDINLASTGNLTLNPGITVASNGAEALTMLFADDHRGNIDAQLHEIRQLAYF